MKLFFGITLLALFMAACEQTPREPKEKESDIGAHFNGFLHNYYENRMQLFPLEATFNGDDRYNDTLTIDISVEERERQRNFFSLTLDSLNQFNYDLLNRSEKLSYDVLKRDLLFSIEGLLYHDNYMPVNQFSCLPLTMAQLGGGQNAQPFKTVQDYQNWLKRLDIYTRWLDTAIIYFRKGIRDSIVLPKAIVAKVLPQTKAMIVGDPAKSIFYDPVKRMPASFDSGAQVQLKAAYTKMIAEKLTPAYERLYNFLKEEYQPHARITSGIDDLPEGETYYRYLVRLNTTLDLSPEEIQKTGLQEVARIKGEMEKVKEETGFRRDMDAFLRYLNTSWKFRPFRKPEEIIQAFQNIYDTIKPNIDKLFINTPKTKFEIRQTEAFRAKSASAEYNPGTPDGSRPGIFYVPITNARTYNVTSGMESLFLHEAIPGHHFQISLQQENEKLPDFRKFGGNSAYVEGWALYAESLGKELGLYKDLYQYMGALGDEMHRAIRLVVDVGIHSGKMTREEAIAYMMENEAISRENATAEIERYMVIPAQALSYKIGSMKIKSLRDKYQAQLGALFDVKNYHREVLKDGSLPLTVLEQKLDTWANGVK